MISERNERKLVKMFTCEVNICPNYFGNRILSDFLPGQQLQVTVKLNLTEELRIYGIYIQLYGKAHVRFDVDDSDQVGHYASDEDVLDMRKCLWDGNEEVRLLSIGAHEYSFTFILPEDLPSSFESSFGRIKYTAYVIVRMPFGPDKIFEEKFSVRRRLDLNDYPSLRSEVSKHNSFISARMPCGGYVCGQSTSLQVSVRITYRSLYHFVVYIIRKTVYHHKSALGEHRKTVLSIEFKRDIPLWQCERNTRETFPALKFDIPEMIDTETNKLISTSYFISIKGFKDSRGYDISEAFISLDIPIKIGSIRFEDSTSDTVIQPSSRANPRYPVPSVVHVTRPLETRPVVNPSATQIPDDDTVSIRTYASTPPPFPDDDIELPSYEEAMLMDLRSIEDSLAQMNVKSTNN